MFDFSEERKEKYYKRAEQRLEADGLTCFKVDRNQISVQKNESVRVYMKPWSKKSVSAEELAAVKRMEGFHVISDRYTRRAPGKDKPIGEIGYLKMELDAEDM